jgi:hypothetical protein
LFRYGLWIWICFRLTQLLLWSLLRKPEPRWDEVSFWWTAPVQVNALGLHQYLKTYWLANYEPAFPLASLVTTLPGYLLGDFENSLRVVPWILGVYALFTLRALLRGRSALAETVFLAAFLALLLRPPWNVMFWFQYLAGEPMAVLSILFCWIVLDRRRGLDRRHSKLGWILMAVGIGVMLRLSKPPAAVIGLPLFAGWLAYEFWKLRSGRGNTRERERISLLGGIVVGALSAHLLWKASILQAAQKVWYVGHNYAQWPKFERIFQEIIPFWLGGGRLLMLGCLGLALGLSVLYRRDRWPALLSMGFVGSILALYATAFREVEIESSARYLMHGSFAFFFFVLVRRIAPLSRSWKRAGFGGWRKTLSAW